MGDWIQHVREEKKARDNRIKFDVKPAGSGKMCHVSANVETTQSAIMVAELPKVVVGNFRVSQACFKPKNFGENFTFSFLLENPFGADEITLDVCKTVWRQAALNAQKKLGLMYADSLLHQHQTPRSVNATTTAATEP